MRIARFRTAVGKIVVVAFAGLAWSLAGGVFTPSLTETAVANGDTRTIHFYHTHTGESIDATFRVDGRYDQAVLDKLNYFLRDWRNNDQTHMDPRLFDTLWEVYRTAGADQPIQIYSAYRSPETNAMLRRRSRAVAEHSQHILGKAMDTTMPGMSMERIREIAMKMQRGGVGYYQSANFVHIDVGGVRSWPRMSYDQLARLFPDGKTVHIPSNGQPLARYEEARLEIAARGGTEVPPAQESRGFFAWLFGGSDAGRETSPARPEATALAYASNTEGDETAVVSSKPVAAAPAPEQAAAPAPEPVVRSDVAATQQRDPVDLAPQPARADEDSVLPLPPRRPADLVASVDVLPLPPTRPGSSFGLQVASEEFTSVPMPTPRPALDAIGGLISQAPSSAPRRAALPAIITQDDGARHQPPPALAFASTDTTASLRAPSVRTGVTPGVLGLRAVSGARGGVKAAAASFAAAVVTIPPVEGGASIVGLRRAAHRLASSASL